MNKEQNSTTNNHNEAEFRDDIEIQRRAPFEPRLHQAPEVGMRPLAVYALWMTELAGKDLNTHDTRAGAHELLTAMSKNSERTFPEVELNALETARATNQKIAQASKDEGESMRSKLKSAAMRVYTVLCRNVSNLDNLKNFDYLKTASDELGYEELSLYSDAAMKEFPLKEKFEMWTEKFQHAVSVSIKAWQSKPFKEKRDEVGKYTGKVALGAGIAGVVLFAFQDKDISAMKPFLSESAPDLLASVAATAELHPKIALMSQKIAGDMAVSGAIRKYGRKMVASPIFHGFAVTMLGAMASHYDIASEIDWSQVDETNELDNLETHGVLSTNSNFGSEVSPSPTVTHELLATQQIDSEPANNSANQNSSKLNEAALDSPTSPLTESGIHIQHTKGFTEESYEHFITESRVPYDSELLGSDTTTQDSTNKALSLSTELVGTQAATDNFSDTVNVESGGQTNQESSESNSDITNVDSTTLVDDDSKTYEFDSPYREDMHRLKANETVTQVIENNGYYAYGSALTRFLGDNDSYFTDINFRTIEQIQAYGELMEFFDKNPDITMQDVYNAAARGEGWAKDINAKFTKAFENFYHSPTSDTKMPRLKFIQRIP